DDADQGPLEVPALRGVCLARGTRSRTACPGPGGQTYPSRLLDRCPVEVNELPPPVPPNEHAGPSTVLIIRSRQSSTVRLQSLRVSRCRSQCSFSPHSRCSDCVSRRLRTRTRYRP